MSSIPNPDPNPALRRVQLTGGQVLIDLGWRVEIRTKLGKLLACTYRLDGGQWFARHRDGREELTADKPAGERLIRQWCGVADVEQEPAVIRTDDGTTIEVTDDGGRVELALEQYGYGAMAVRLTPGQVGQLLTALGGAR